jgi:hypothetical protein
MGALHQGAALRRSHLTSSCHPPPLTAAALHLHLLPSPQVVLNHRSPGWSSVYGFALPTKYACWAELLVVQLLVPEASFWGHLCGILAGLLHVLLTSRLPGLGSGLGGGARGGGGGGQQRAQGSSRGGSSLGRLLAWLWGGAGRQQQRGRTYGRGTWGAASGSAGGAAAGAAYQVSLPCLCGMHPLPCMILALLLREVKQWRVAGRQAGRQWPQSRLLKGSNSTCLPPLFTCRPGDS